ncbi:MAG: hypothetical protein GTO02_08570, partial [Candidatus Dadabacteria bacterium]|nr:hypothetical protein [Candidatus Dadabacteria bacterium]NIQ14439.1 hypothetical protein [Candidatus Dadabacteria bacterium]
MKRNIIDIKIEGKFERILSWLKELFVNYVSPSVFTNAPNNEAWKIDFIEKKLIPTLEKLQRDYKRKEKENEHIRTD